MYWEFSRRVAGRTETVVSHPGKQNCVGAMFFVQGRSLKKKKRGGIALATLTLLLFRILLRTFIIQVSRTLNVSGQPWTYLSPHFSRLNSAECSRCSGTRPNCVNPVSSGPCNPHFNAFHGKCPILDSCIIYIWVESGPETVVVVLLLASIVVPKSSLLMNLSQISE